MLRRFLQIHWPCMEAYAHTCALHTCGRPSPFESSARLWAYPMKCSKYFSSRRKTGSCDFPLELLNVGFERKNGSNFATVCSIGVRDTYAVGDSAPVPLQLSYGCQRILAQFGRPRPFPPSTLHLVFCRRTIYDLSACSAETFEIPEIKL